VTLTATVTPSVVTGTVTFFNGTANIGSAVLVIEALKCIVRWGWSLRIASIAVDGLLRALMEQTKFRRVVQLRLQLRAVFWCVHMAR